MQQPFLFLYFRNANNSAQIAINQTITETPVKMKKLSNFAEKLRPS
jgi:hypothetical protein